jgi:hypothetical protein
MRTIPPPDPGSIALPTMSFGIGRPRWAAIAGPTSTRRSPVNCRVGSCAAGQVGAADGGEHAESRAVGVVRPSIVLAGKDLSGLGRESA